MSSRSVSGALNALPRSRLFAVAALIALLAIAALVWGSAVGVGDDEQEAPAGLGFSGGASRADDGKAVAPTYDSDLATGAPQEQSAGSFGGVSAEPRGGESADFFGRTIIRTGSVDVEVESVSDAFERVRQVAAAAGGFVSESSFSGTLNGEQQRAHLTLRVPAERFGDVVAELRGIAAEVRSISTSARDVTEEFTDLEATLRNLRAVESQYIELLGRANEIGAILQVQDRLNQVRLQIDRTQARLQTLESLSEMATITVALNPLHEAAVVEVDGGGVVQAARDAWEASLETLEALAIVGVVAIVYSWWLIPAVLLALLIARRIWRSRTPTEASS